MQPRPPWSLILLSTLAVVMIANIGFLDYLYVSGRAEKQKVQQEAPVPLPITTETQGSVCSPLCITAIENATTSSVATTTISTPPSKPTSSKTPAVTTGLPKDYFIPLGTGFTQDNNWVNVGGTDITIDPASYGKIKQVVFQASMHIPVANGTIYARLYNVTDNHPVWYSDVSTSEGSSTMVSSANITLDPGSKLYRVQIKTSLQYPSYLDFSRIKITIQ